MWDAGVGVDLEMKVRACGVEYGLGYGIGFANQREGDI